MPGVCGACVQVEERAVGPEEGAAFAAELGETGSKRNVDRIDRMQGTDLRGHVVFLCFVAILVR